ncbi:glycosyl hydrolase family 28 protein [Paenibacillus sp. GCM10023252]|uniref:glycosyl hydrolase family 28 protein n=1 Tax=Paenibacillus sp. GCM10023252 TaxID=3252649 RepID=UPI00360DE8D3
MMTQVKLYDVPAQMKPSPDYRLEVNGEQVFVYCFPGMAGGTVSWASFDFEGEVRIRISCEWRMDTAEVHPLSYGIQSEFKDDAIEFTLKEPANLFIKWNEEFDLPFYLFAGPLEDLPTEGPGVRYYGPGIHHAGDLELLSNETLVLDGGAFVYGTVQAVHAENVKVIGRGILCGSHLSFGLPEGHPAEMMGFKSCRNVLVDGIMVLDSFGWTICGYDCDGWTVRNTKIVNERKWSTDGINPVNSRDVLLDRCFVRCKDDCVSIKGLVHEDRYDTGRSPIENIVVQDSVFWSDNNNALVVGTEMQADYIRNIVFRNLDVLKVSNTCGDYAAALTVGCLDDTEVSDITFEDIRIEHAIGPLINIWMRSSIFSDSIRGTRTPEGCTVRRLRFRNIELTGGRFRRSYIEGLDEIRRFEDIEFDHLVIQGRRIRSAEEGRFEINAFADNIRFV